MVEETTGAVSKAIALKQTRVAEAGGEVMSLGEHLEELRKRLIYAILGLAPIFITGLIFGKTLMGFFIAPMQKALEHEGLRSSLQSTGIFEVFSAWVMLAFLVTVVVGFPWILYQAWKFIAPGLYEHERRFVYLLMPLSISLSALGVAFMYYVALPAMLAFFVHFSDGIMPRDPGISTFPAGITVPQAPILQGDPPDAKPGQIWFNESLHQLRVCIGMDGTVPRVLGAPLEKATAIQQVPKIREYLDQVIMFGLMFAVAFQAPVVVLLMGWVGFVDVPLLKKSRRIAIFVIAAISAVVTPPDPLSMMLLAVPLYVLYEFGVLLLWKFPSPRAIGKKASEGEGPGAEA